MALLRELLAPAVRIEVPRRLVSHIIGKKGSKLRELEAASGASVKVFAESEPCFVEASGNRAATDQARELLERLMEQHTYDSFEIPREVALHVAGRRGAALREV